MGNANAFDGGEINTVMSLNASPGGRFPWRRTDVFFVEKIAQVQCLPGFRDAFTMVEGLLSPNIQVNIVGKQVNAMALAGQRAARRYDRQRAGPEGRPGENENGLGDESGGFLCADFLGSELEGDIVLCKRPMVTTFRADVEFL